MALVQDLRFALRQLLKRPGFTITAVLILALGLGANTAIFSVVNVFLLRPLPYSHPEQLAALWERNVAGNGEKYDWVAPGSYVDWRKYATSFEAIAAFFTGPVTIADRAESIEPQRVEAAAVPRELFPMLGINPMLGRVFSPEEDRYHSRRVAVISYSLWKDRFGSASDIVSKTIRVDGVDCPIVGVMPRGFAYPLRTTELWLPLNTFQSPEREKIHDGRNLRALGRLKPGVSFDQAGAELEAISVRYFKAHPHDLVARGATVTPLQFSMVRDVRSSLLILLGAVSCVLLIACVNVANLLLARASGRTREVAVRAALGAGRWRIVQQLLIESSTLAICGGILGAVIAAWTTQFLALHAPGADMVLASTNISVDATVFLFAFGVALLAGIAAGIFPALQMSHVDLVTGLRQASRSATANSAQGRFRNILVTAEVAISLGLLIAAGLLAHSFSRLYQVQPGVRLDHTLTLTIPLLHEPPEQIAAFLRELPGHVNTVPGVVSSGLINCLPLTGHCSDNSFHIEGHPEAPGQNRNGLTRNAGPGYFTAAGIPLLRGRTFTVNDGIGGDELHPKPGAIVINSALAKTYFPNEDPIGKRIFLEYHVTRERMQGIPVPSYEIIGVVGDARATLDHVAEPTMYLPLLDQNGDDQVFLTVHTSGPPLSVASGVRQQISRANPNVAVDQIRSMQELAGLSAADHQFNMALFGSFAVLALLLASAGLYAVLSYTVSERKNELGIRMALGATSADVSRWVLRQGLKPAIAGVVLGLAISAAAGRIIKSLLFGVETFDPITFAVLPLLMLAIAALACYIPAVRATRIDPTVTLRME